MFSLLAATELTDGVWYPRGGFGTVRDALEKIARKLGVALRTGANVEEITLEDAADGSKRVVRAPRQLRQSLPFASYAFCPLP